MEESDILVRIEDLVFRRGDRAIFNGVNLIMPKGKVTAVMGPSGSGKTTLLKLMCGQIRPESGRIVYDGQDIAGLSRSALTSLRGRMSMLFQSGALFTDLSVFENVAYPLREHTNFSEELIRDLVLLKLNCVGLRGAWALMPSELSGGMRRRVALARSIALDPEFIMYDEPFAGQDPISMGVLVRLIRRLSDALNLTSVVVSHDVNETLCIADYVYVIADGGVIGHGTPNQVVESENPQIAQFMNGRPDGPVPFHYPGQSEALDFFGEEL